MLCSWVGVGLVLGLAAGCGKLLPDAQIGDETTSGTTSTGGSTTTTGADDTSVGDPTGPGSGSSATDTGSTDVTGATDTTGTTGTPDGCGDRMPMTGELCYVQDQFDLADAFCDIELGDVEGDGITDLVLLRCGVPSVITILGSGAGLVPPIFTDTSLSDNLLADSASEFALGDVIGQRQPDVVVPDQTGLVSFINSNATFESATAYLSADSFVQVETALVDGDALVDVLAATNDSFRLLSGQGLGAFSAGPSYDTLLSGIRIQPAHVDVDDQLDMLMLLTNSPQSQVQLFLDIGGGFVSAQTLMIPGAVTMAHGDLDDDSDVDLVATVQVGGPSDELQTFIYDEMNGYSLVGLGTPEIPDVVHMALADLDTDERDDLITVHWDGGMGSLRLARNVGDGAAFEEVETFTLPAEGAFLRIGDVNTDMMPDVVVVTTAGHVFQLLSDP